MKKLVAIVVACVAVVAIGACAKILGFEKKPAVFPHRAHVVAGISCTRCHGDVGSGSGLHLPEDKSCTDGCHAKPHDPGPCTSCHVAQVAVEQLIEAKDHLKFQHARHLPRANNNCMRCHSAVAEGDQRMRPTMSTCFRCHDRDAGSNAAKCDACHKDLVSEGTLPATHLAHDGDWAREHGTRAAASGQLCESCHQASFCASCHGQTVPALPARAHFDDPFRPSVHRAGFAARHALEARSDPGACQTCHTPDKCASCHIAKGVMGESRTSPHPAGWVGPSENQHGREARRDPAACAACHGGAGETLCVGCHKVGGVGGNPHPPGWSSRQPMSAMPCRMCHPLGSR